MEKYKKKDMLEAVNLLLHVNDSVVKNAKANKKEDIIEALAQCQDVALALGNYLESLGEIGEGFVHILEDYCENLYHMSLIFSDENLCRKVSKKVKKQLSSLKTSISLELPSDKIEMVFLPYKVSMWDSLESVWRAASEDSECEAYVMPIPYFERDLKGELAVEHYEGNQFPKDVPIVNYLDYNLMEHKPDVVFIHNPYDQHNYVTSIHPSYYIPELKKCGCKIVYIPYYISSEANPDALEVQNGREGYVITPGVLYSDMVFVQSENIKRLFVNILEKKVSDVGRRYWEDRIFGLGSPKLDRVHNVERNDALLPEKWKKMIYTEEGIRKKIVFYNISINALLNTYGMLDKIVDVLKFLKNNRSVVLWWRPHPLYESTITAMRPGLLENYKEIVRKYREEEWGIFDEGVDLEWAIAETDAYYGDSSSVVQLYKELKKPIMIQNSLVNTEQCLTAENIPIWPSVFCVDEDDIWFVHGKINILMRYNISNDYTYIVDIIPNEKLFQECLYSSIYKWKQRIFLIPCWANEIKVYDIPSKKFTVIPLKDTGLYNNKLLFCKSYVFENKLYCIPYYYGAIVKIDLDNINIIYFDIAKQISRINGDFNKCVYINDATRIDDEVYSIIANTNKVLIFSLKTEKFRIQDISSVESDFVSIANIGNNVFLYDELLHEMVKIEKNSFEKENLYYLPFIGIKMNTINSKFILIDPVDNDEIRIIDSDGKIIYKDDKCIGELKNSLYPDLKCGTIYEGEENSSYYYNSNNFLLSEFRNGEIYKSYKFMLQKAEFTKLKEIIMNMKQHETLENEMFGLNLWIRQVEDMADHQAKGYRNSGKTILEKVKGLCI